MDTPEKISQNSLKDETNDKTIKVITKPLEEAPEVTFYGAAPKIIIKPLEEAPFSEYLRILRENGYVEDADFSEAFYLEVLLIPFEDGKSYTKEQVYATPFKDVLKAAEKLISGVYDEVAKSMSPMATNGPMLKGPDAEKLPPEALNHLARRQIEEVEGEKQRILMSGGYRYG